ncbi:MAG: helix-turn-helix domain-containing protein, partial [Candidatus Thorarchaeota archaeon]
MGGNIYSPTAPNHALKTYRYRMYPSRKQQDAIRRHIGACRFVYNWALEKKI